MPNACSYIARYCFFHIQGWVCCSKSLSLLETALDKTSPWTKWKRSLLKFFESTGYFWTKKLLFPKCNPALFWKVPTEYISNWNICTDLCNFKKRMFSFFYWTAFPEVISCEETFVSSQIWRYFRIWWFRAELTHEKYQEVMRTNLVCAIRV